MIEPSPLKVGDKVGIVAPGRKVKPEEIDVAQKTILEWGLKPVYSTNLFSDTHGYLSASDSDRLADIQNMINDSSIRAILSARGGYGTTRILDNIKLEKFKKFPKWMVGFSDITALHLRLSKEGYMSIHGTMPIFFSKSESQASVESLRKILFGESLVIEASANELNRAGNAQGHVMGGNLSLILDSLGTRNEADTAGKILVLEEIDEYRYKIDRMLVQLKRAGKFNDLSGLIIGHFTDIKDTALAFGESVAEMIRHHTKEFEFPIGFNFPIGHENPNLPFKHGSTMQLTVSKELSVLKPI